jgi:hypothetical protein
LDKVILLQKNRAKKQGLCYDSRTVQAGMPMTVKGDDGQLVGIHRLAVFAGLPIPPPPFALGLSLQGGHSKGFGRVRLPYPAPVCADAAPFLHKHNIAKQVPLHVHRVKPRHVAGRVDPVEGASHS